MIAFDPIDVQDQIEMIFTVNEETQEMQETYSSINDRFQELGYDSPFFLNNIGALIFVIMFQLVLIPLCILLWKCRFCHGKVRKRAGKQVKECFFNGILAFIDGTLLVILIMGMINLKMNNLDAVERDDSYYLSIIALAVCGLELILFPLFVLIWLQ